MKRVILTGLFGLALTVFAGAQAINLEELTANDEFRWGVVSLHDGRINEAIASFTRSLSFASERPLTRYWLGRAYYYAGLEEAALDEWRWVAERDGRTAVLDAWIERVELSRGLTTERLGRDVVPGRYVTMVDLSGRQGDLEIFNRPASVRPRGDGYVYVTSYGSHAIVLLDPNGVREEVIDGGLEGFDRPFDLAILEDGSLLVSEFGSDRIARVNPDGFKVGTFGTRGIGAGELLGPQYLATDGVGHLYVSDYGNARVSKFTVDGEFLFSFGSSVPGFPGLVEPAGIVAVNERVYVADRARGTIVVFDASGNYLGAIESPLITAPEGLSRHRTGELLVTDANRLAVVELATERVTVIAELNPARRLLAAALDANGNLVATDFRSDSLLVMAASEELYTGLNVEIDFVNALEHPRVFAAVTVTDRNGRPLLGLDETNFRITEDRFPTGALDVEFAGYRDAGVAVALVVEPTGREPDSGEAVRAAALDVHDELGSGDRMWVVSSGEQPLVETTPSAGRLSVADAAVGASSPAVGERSRTDLAIRLGVSQLLGELRRRSIVVVSDGTLDPGAFSEYSLAETAEHLVNNHVTLSVIYTRRAVGSRELDFLARTSGGLSIYAFQPEGAGVVVEHAKELPSGSYLLVYNSVHDSDFGRRYIPLEVEAYLLERSGRDEAGYFGPLEF